MNKKVFYIGDIPPLNVSDWANKIAEESGVYKPLKLPYSIFRSFAYFGDFIRLFGIQFPLTSFRLENMTSDNIIDLKNLYEIVGRPPFGMIEGIKHTLAWLHEGKDIW